MTSIAQKIVINPKPQTFVYIRSTLTYLDYQYSSMQLIKICYTESILQCTRCFRIHLGFIGQISGHDRFHQKNFFSKNSCSPTYS